MIKELEQTLFDEWKTKRGYTHFISDGLIDENEWNRQPIKILFILKEANWENASADLCQFLLSESSPTYWRTWNNIARWTKAILEPGIYPRYISSQDKSYWLRKVAFINLKKVGGYSIADHNCIRAYATEDKFFIRRQIQLYDPDIIICCGRGKGKNADILHDIVWEPYQVSPWQQPITDSSYHYFWYFSESKRVPVISYYHPQIRGGHTVFEKRYKEMMEIAAYFDL